MANIIIFFIISLSSFDNLCFVGSFDNILVFFPLIIINLWFICFFDDNSIRVHLVTLHYIKQKCLLKHHGFIGVIDGNFILMKIIIIFFLILFCFFDHFFFFVFFV